MTREFQVLYRERKPAGYEIGLPGPNGRETVIDMGSLGPVMTVLVLCESEDQARNQFEASGFLVVAVNFVRAVVDWSKPNLDRDEAAEYLRIKGDTLSINKGGGEIPFAKVGRGIYPRAWLDQLVNDSANAAGKRIAKDLAVGHHE